MLFVFEPNGVPLREMLLVDRWRVVVLEFVVDPVDLAVLVLVAAPVLEQEGVLNPTKIT